MENKELMPIEITDLATRVSEEKKGEVQTVLNDLFIKTADWERQVDEIDVKGIEDTMSMSLADTARLNVKNVRLGAEKTLDAKRGEVQAKMANFKTEDALWLKTKQIVQIKLKAIEEKAAYKAKFKERYEAEQKALVLVSRIAKISKYKEVSEAELSVLSDESFNSLLAGLEKEYDDKIEAEKKAAAELIAKQKADAEENERIRKENERLAKENEAIEAKRAQEAEAAANALKAEQAKAAAEKAKAEKEAAEIEYKRQAEMAAEKVAREKVEKELEAKRAQEAEAEKAKADEQKKLEAEQKKAAKAPVKIKLNAWVDSFSIQDVSVDNEKTQAIKDKFEGFKVWAKQQVENL